MNEEDDKMKAYDSEEIKHFYQQLAMNNCETLKKLIEFMDITLYQGRWDERFHRADPQLFDKNCAKWKEIKDYLDN